jgi:RluA family pseudouridine synthase
MVLVRLIARRLRDTSLEQAEALVKAGGVYVGSVRVRIPTVRVAAGERISVHPDAANIPMLDPQGLRIVMRDPEFMVLEKPPGIPVSATRDSARGTLSEALGRLLADEGVRRPYVGVVHRLDRRASGLVLFTVRTAANPSLHQQFLAHEIHRSYRIRVPGETPESLVCTLPLRELASGLVRVARPGEPHRQTAETRFRRVAVLPGPETLLEAELITGRTHQIRVHAAALGYPILGDRRYGGLEAAGAPDSGPPEGFDAFRVKPLLLHAWKLTFRHPRTGDPVHVEGELPLWAQTPQLASQTRSEDS